jgi:hypothetical protein
MCLLSNKKTTNKIRVGKKVVVNHKKPEGGNKDRAPNIPPEQKPQTQASQKAA